MDKDGYCRVTTALDAIDAAEREQIRRRRAYLDEPEAQRLEAQGRGACAAVMRAGTWKQAPQPAPAGTVFKPTKAAHLFVVTTP